MNILVTNDDGIESPGIWALAESLSKIGSVLLVAPDEQQSGVGTSISFSRKNTTIQETRSPIPGVMAFAVGGTPSDCVLLGLKRLKKGHIDLIVSGINKGPNLGNDIPYSGTVMATLVGYFRKIPSMAISVAIQKEEEPIRFDVAARVALSLVASIQNNRYNINSIINVNIPNIPPGHIKGVLATRAAGFGYVRLGRAIDNGGSAGYDSIFGKPEQESLEENTDVWAIGEGYISITPLQFDITDHKGIPLIAECFKHVGDELRD